MMTTIAIFLTGWILGSIVVSSNPSPYFAAFGLVFVAGVGGAALVLYGGTYFCFVLLFAYLGGMMVVFGFTSSMASDPFPSTLGSSQVLNGMVTYLFFVVSFGFVFFKERGEKPGNVATEEDPLAMSRGDTQGITFVFWAGGCVLMVCGWGLLLTLVVIMQVVQAVTRRTVRPSKF